MKTIKHIIILAMFALPGAAFASLAGLSDVDDTILADVRYDKYYYTKWFDECFSYYPDGGVIDSTLCRFFQRHNFYGSSVAKWEHTDHRMQVKGLVAMVDKNLPPNAAASGSKLPEYLYLYQLVGRHQATMNGIEDGLDLVLLDSVRWDTATARVMELRRGWNGEFTQYIYLYEAYFDHPVYVDSDFYIFGSTNSNVHTFPGSGQWLYSTTNYVDIMDWGAGARIINKDSIEYFEDRFQGTYCRGQGGWVAIYDRQPSQMGWYTPWPDSPWGYYLPIVDQWDLDATPNDDSFGEVLGVYVPKAEGKNTYVIVARGVGAYKGSLELLVNITNGEIVKIASYEANETPGLGSKALKEEYFEQFYKKKISPDTPLFKLVITGDQCPGSQSCRCDHQVHGPVFYLFLQESPPPFVIFGGAGC